MLVHSIEELKREIEKERKSNLPSAIRYPVRFILLNSFRSLKEIIYFLSNLGCNEVHLADFLPHSDGWLTKNDILNIIKVIDQDSVVVSFSEFLRFSQKDEFSSILTSLTEIENQENIRIFLPLLGLKERFQRGFWEGFHRRPFWEEFIWFVDEAQQKTTIFWLSFDADSHESIKVIRSTKEWLELYKREWIDNIFLSSETLSYLAKNFLPDSAFDVVHIANYKELLAKCFDVDIGFEFKEEETNFWRKLYGEVLTYDISDNNLERIISHHFNIYMPCMLTAEELLKQYLQANSRYDRWLLRNFALENLSDSYLNYVLKQVKRYESEEVLELLWLAIFDRTEIKTSYFLERKNLLLLAHKELNWPTSLIEEALKVKLKELFSQGLGYSLRYLTGIAFEEKRLILDALQRSIDLTNDLHSIRETYPEVYHYMAWQGVTLDNVHLEDWILDYFREYNLSKVTNRKSKKLEDLLAVKNCDKETFSQWYYAMETVRPEDGQIVWIDGLGAEWLPFLIYLVQEYGKEKDWYLEGKYLVRVNLPSVTECNRYNVERVGELDQHIHNEKPYRFPDDLIYEINLIKQIFFERVFSQKYERIVIVSDHGFTFLSQRKFGSKKVFDFQETHHEGRCKWIKNSEEFSNGDYYMVWETDSGACKGNKALIALRHLSLCDTPSREVHGGATPEEVLVPYLVLSRDIEKIDYEVEPKTFQISVKAPVIRFTIKPMPKHTPAISLKGKSFKISLIRKKEEWEANLTGLNVGKHRLELRIGNKTCDIFVEITGGFRETELL